MQFNINITYRQLLVLLQNLVKNKSNSLDDIVHVYNAETEELLPVQSWFSINKDILDSNHIPLLINTQDK
jgi:hypothetical protein